MTKIVTGTIQPILAKDLRLPGVSPAPTALRQPVFTRAPDLIKGDYGTVDAATFVLARQIAHEILDADLTVAGKDGERWRRLAADYLAHFGADAAMDEARQTAQTIIAEMASLPLAPLACDLICLAFATLSD